MICSCAPIFKFSLRRQMAPLQSIKFQTTDFPIFCALLLWFYEQRVYFFGDEIPFPAYRTDLKTVVRWRYDWCANGKFSKSEKMPTGLQPDCLHGPYHPALCFSSSVIFLLVDACVGLNWLLVSFFLSHVHKNIIHSFIQIGECVLLW